MKHTTTITYHHCKSSDLQKNGHCENGTQRWRCKCCKKSFQLSYSYKARISGVKNQIDDLILNSSGVGHGMPWIRTLELFWLGSMAGVLIQVWKNY